ncbi:SGNH/GDSL hydrolase family protein [Rhodococcus sp. NPDC058514]|uniref:SGNH/GDSL hydrolase family protein n=1 Tax=unclassified Rhodococcus (in: high G+C Gram-positive bacteria) TaxID=192944 RepID=UPI00365D0FD6
MYDTLITTPLTTDVVHGALDLESTVRGIRPHRLPAWARAQSGDPQLVAAQAQPSGVRVAFRTRATVVELEVLPTKVTYPGAPPRPDGVYDLLVDGVRVRQAVAAGGDIVTIDLATGSSSIEPGSPTTMRFADLPAAEKGVEIWLPHNETAELVALRTNAPVEPHLRGGRKVWLHHGSSISQGSNALSPTGIWPSIGAAIGGVDLVNLGFSGSMLLDPFAARVMRDAEADVISVKIGINLVNMDVMRLRALGPAVHGFLDTIRDGHPDTPLVVISPLYCPIHETTPGPGAFDVDALAEGVLRFRATGDPAERAAGKLTLEVIREELGRIVQDRAGDDPSLHLLDGRDLYGEADFADHPLPDRLHPDAAAHQLIGERFGQYAFREGGPFGG